MQIHSGYEDDVTVDDNQDGTWTLSPPSTNPGWQNAGFTGFVVDYLVTDTSGNSLTSQAYISFTDVSGFNVHEVAGTNIPVHMGISAKMSPCCVLIWRGNPK